MTRYAAAVVVAAHGVIHLIGFVVPWRLADVEGSPYRTTVLAGVAWTARARVTHAPTPPARAQAAEVGS